MKQQKKNYLKYTAIVLVTVFLITAALLLVELWDNSIGRFPVVKQENGVVKYKGQEYVLKDNVETFLILGLDKFKGETTSDSHDGSVQADFLMLLVFDNEARTTTAVQINRDTMANVHRLDIAGNKIGLVEKKQIALAYNYAYKTEGSVNCRNTADSVSDLLKDTKIDHYFSLTMDSVVEMNDLVGGVEVVVLDDFTGIDDTLVKGESVTLMGEQALRYVRTRYGLEDSSNNTRMERQQQYVNALFEKFQTLASSDLEFALKAADKIKPYLEYDSTDFRLKEFAERFNDYEFLGIKELEGKTKVGEDFMEFHPTEESIWKLVIEQFYEEKKD